MARRIHLVTFGCQMNKLDSELALASLRAAGWEEAETAETADAVLFNTCAVRDQAENRVLSALGLLKARKEADPGFLIGVLGCMAERRGAALLRRYPQVDLVAGTRMIGRIGELLDAAAAAPVVAVGEEEAGGLSLPPRAAPGTRQAYLAAMRGCDNYCSYCIVPYVRGRESSRSLDEIAEEAERLVNAGAREITLLGQSIDRYGRDLSPRSSLAELLERIDRLPGLLRLRFVTAHPRGIDETLFRAMAALPTVCEHLHMPAQSGSDAVLAAMNRGYGRARYEALLAQGRETVPGLAFSSDFIVGFPGESEADAAATLDLVERAQFQNIFAFRYSPRPGTAAAKRRDDVPEEAKEARLQALLGAQERVSRARQERLAAEGARVRILIEGTSKRDPSHLMGRTRQNAIVMVPAPAGPDEREALVGTEREAVVTSATPLTLFARLA